jgi:hypothetical protein
MPKKKTLIFSGSLGNTGKHSSGLSHVSKYHQNPKEGDVLRANRIGSKEDYYSATDALALVAMTMGHTP